MRGFNWEGKGCLESPPEVPFGERPHGKDFCSGKLVLQGWA